MSYPHRKHTLFHTLTMDATAAITLAAGEEVKLSTSCLVNGIFTQAL